MKVRELIEQLQAADPEAQVIIQISSRSNNMKYDESDDIATMDRESDEGNQIIGGWSA